jgi:putative Mn2+ efflux pump MntP
MSIHKSIHKSIRWLAGWLAGLLAGWLAGWLAGCLAAWLAGWLLLLTGAWVLRLFFSSAATFADRCMGFKPSEKTKSLKPMHLSAKVSAQGSN